jgi:hypothetical protein
MLVLHCQRLLLKLRGRRLELCRSGAVTQPQLCHHLCNLVLWQLLAVPLLQLPWVSRVRIWGRRRSDNPAHGAGVGSDSGGSHRRGMPQRIGIRGGCPCRACCLQVLHEGHASCHGRRNDCLINIVRHGWLDSWESQLRHTTGRR